MDIGVTGTGLRGSEEGKVGKGRQTGCQVLHDVWEPWDSSLLRWSKTAG